jgi:hypothetical protein
VLTLAMERLHAIVRAAFPTGIRLHPDDDRPFEAALATAQAQNLPLVRYYQPQLLRIAGEAHFLCTVDVVARTSDDAAADASILLHAINTTARAPNGVLSPRAVPIRETSYYRVSISFTLFVPTTVEPDTVSSS